MAPTSACSLCGMEDSWRHSLLNCVVARSVWSLADEGVTVHFCTNDSPSAKVWLFAMMNSLSRDDFARVAVTLWAIWFARRKIIHEEEYQSPLSTHLFIQSYLRDLIVVADRNNTCLGLRGGLRPSTSSIYCMTDTKFIEYKSRTV
jgi:hypothetical protein